MNRRRVVLTCLAAWGLFGLTVAVLIPWWPLGRDAPTVRPDLHATFTAIEIAKVAGFRSALGPWPYVGILLSIAVPWCLYAVCYRSLRLGPTSRSLRGIRRLGLIWAVVVGVVVLQWVLVSPFSVHSELVLRRFGLSTQNWLAWLADQALELGLTCFVTGVGATLTLWLVRRFPARWPWLLAGAVAGATLLGSWVYPIVVEPAFNAHQPLAAGPLNERIQRLAAAEGFPDIRVAVSNASIRTTTENAHVSGFGATRWAVLHDNLVARGKTDPSAVLAVVAHELGHVKHQDVLRGTAIGAVGGVAAVLLLSLGLTTDRGQRRFLPHTDRGGDVVRGVVLFLAIASTVPLVSAPLSNVLSRRIEASADIYALEATRNVPAFIRMQHDLATSNLTVLDPSLWQTIFFATHPDPTWRIAQARAWQLEPHRPR
jgi:STE24 endopeptidase